MPVEDIFHVQKDEAYDLQAQEEAAYYDQPRLMGMDVESPVTTPYINEIFTNDSDLAWFETIPRYGKFRRGCALGAGGLKQRARILEQNPELHLTIYDISSESLATLERGLGDQFPGRVTTETIDLNFIEMPSDTFDLIVSSGCLHHLYNLEHIAFQINRSLTREGHVFLQDYVGEAKFQFGKKKKQTFEEAFVQIQEREPLLRHWRIDWPDVNNWNYSPFEALRSNETLGVFRRYMNELEVRSTGGLLTLTLFVFPPLQLGQPQSIVDVVLGRLASIKWLLLGARGGPIAARAKLASALLVLDRELLDSGTLLPNNAFAVYRKRAR